MNANLQYIVDALLGLALVGLILYRQMTWRPVDPSRLWRAPLVLGIIGAILIATASKATVLHTVDIAALAVELVLSLIIGAVMGSIARFRPMTQQAIAEYHGRQTARNRPAADVRTESRTGWLGLVLWVVLIVVRVGIELVAQHLGAHAATSTGVILLVVAANRAARVAVFSYRLEQHHARVAR